MLPPEHAVLAKHNAYAGEGDGDGWLKERDGNQSWRRRRYLHRCRTYYNVSYPIDASYPVILNYAEETVFAGDVEATIAGDQQVHLDIQPLMDDEDCSCMSKSRPSSFIFINSGDSVNYIVTPVTSTTKPSRRKLFGTPRRDCARGLIAGQSEKDGFDHLISKAARPRLATTNCYNFA